MNALLFNLMGEGPEWLRYQEDDSTQVIGSLFFHKSTFGKLSESWASDGVPPKVIEITVKEVK